MRHQVNHAVRLHRQLANRAVNSAFLQRAVRNCFQLLLFVIMFVS